jgi:nicotinamidase-related amidase
VVNIRLGMPQNSWGVSADLVDLRRDPAPSAVVTVTARPQKVTLDLARTAIIVVDMQNDFCHPDGWLASIGIDQCVLATLTDAACAGYDVVLVEDCAATTSPGYCFDATVYNVAQCFGFVTTSTALLAGER